MKYPYNSTTQLSPHFRANEFRCKCGKNHDTEINPSLVEKLEKIYTSLGCSKIIVTSGYRCPEHDKSAAVGGNGKGQHTLGTAADICCYGKDGKPISSKKVCCAAQDAGFMGIANITRDYIYTHVDVRSGATKWLGDETVTTSYSVCSNFYDYYKLSKSDVYGTNVQAKRTKDIKITVDGITYSGTLTEV